MEAKGARRARPQARGLLQQLEAIDEREVRRLQRNPHRAAHFFRYYAEHDAEQDPGYYRASEGTAQAMVVNGHPVDPLVAGRFPDGGATEMLLAELERRADGGLAAACKKERAEPHYYLRMQHCGRAAAGKEIANLERQLTQQKEGSRRFVEIMKGITTAYKGGSRDAGAGAGAGRDVWRRAAKRIRRYWFELEFAFCWVGVHMGRVIFLSSLGSARFLLGASQG